MPRQLNRLAVMRALALAGLILTLAACATEPRQGMYWGNYEQSLYRVADAPNERVRQQHLANLRQIINVSDARGWPPPPGIMLELAALEAGLGNQEAYTLLVNREYHLYPESRPFIQRWFMDVMITARDPNAAREETDSDHQQEESDTGNNLEGGNP